MGVPIKSKALNELDPTLAIVQMSTGVPVVIVAIKTVFRDDLPFTYSPCFKPVNIRG